MGRASFIPLVSRLMYLFRRDAQGSLGTWADFLVPRQALPQITGSRGELPLGQSAGTKLVSKPVWFL